MVVVMWADSDSKQKNNEIGDLFEKNVQLGVC
jgi:hypothetical protein